MSQCKYASQCCNAVSTLASGENIIRGRLEATQNGLSKPSQWFSVLSTDTGNSHSQMRGARERERERERERLTESQRKNDRRTKREEWIQSDRDERR